MRAQLLAALGAEVGRCDVEHRAAARLSLFGEAVGCAGVGDEHARRELRIRVELQRELDDMLVFLLVARSARADDEAAVCETAVVALELFLADEVYRRVYSSK